MERLRAGAWAACCLASLATIGMLIWTRTTIVGKPLASAIALVIAILAIHWLYTFSRPEPRISTAFGCLGVMFWGGLAAGITGLAGLRSGVSLVDAELARSDQAMGIDASAFVTWVALHPPLPVVLQTVYLATLPAVFMTVLLLAWTRRQAEAWDAALAFAGGAIVCACVSAFVPAAGSFVQTPLPASVMRALPTGAGVYYLPVFDAFRSGRVTAINVWRLEGVVTFPSFHAVMGLIVVKGLWGVRGWRVPATLWSLGVLLSTIPIGGHYGTDVVGGAGVWAAFAALGQRLRRTAGEAIFHNIPSTTLCSSDASLNTSLVASLGIPARSISARRRQNAASVDPGASHSLDSIHAS